MPFYEYRCNDCARQFEQLVSTSQADKKQICPFCGGEKTEKLLSVFSSKSSSDIGGVKGGGFT